jgi:hypothetical protein
MTQDGIPLEGLDEIDAPEIDIDDIAAREPWMCGQSSQDVDDLVAAIATNRAEM